MPYDWKRHRDRSRREAAGPRSDDRGRARRAARAPIGPYRSDLVDALRSRDRGPYPAYRDLRGRYALDGLDIELVRVQPDPFAGPSLVRLLIPWGRLPLGPHVALEPGTQAGDATTTTPPHSVPNGGTAISRLPGARSTPVPGIVCSRSAALVAVRDFLGRTVGAWLDREAPRGGKGPSVRIVAHGQEMLDRTSVLLLDDGVELRLSVDLPAEGRRILAREATERLLETPERLLAHLERLDVAQLDRHVTVAVDFAALQETLAERGWVAFVADGSRLARRAGNDDRPLGGEEVVPFTSPEGLRSEVELPGAGIVSGMGLPEGVTLLCGGGFHGKSTLLRALGAALVPHIPGDGRELVALRPDAQTIRAEDGRAIHEVDLRPFLRDLPLGRSTESMSTENASGSTSQAAAILEALRAGVRCLLLDEDTSATNFMIRDPLMERLLARDQEPIQPYLHQARTLFEHLGVSSILVVGGSGEYFRVADRVLVLDTYRPYDETGRAKEIARERDPILPDSKEAARFRDAISTERRQAAGPPASRDRGLRVRTLGARSVLVERIELDLSGIEALRDPSQARFLARVLAWRAGELSRSGTGESPVTVAGMLRAFSEEWDRAGLLGFGDFFAGDLAATRVVEVLAAIDRLRSRPAPRPDWGLDDGDRDEEE
ncbi:MAG: ABC-ATPase domain-containing protein [Candidatus Eisenbacteria bacterium]